MKNKSILVTGGSGFLGSHLCERLLEAGNEVLCVDNFYTGDKRNIYHLLKNPRFELIRHDITFPLYLEVDEIYNLACPASPIHYQRDPVQTVKTCVHGAINLLGLAKRLGAKILQASTSEVYGGVLGQRQPGWTPLLLRRGEAVCGNTFSRLPDPMQSAGQNCPYLQHLRPPDASE